MNTTKTLLPIQKPLGSVQASILQKAGGFFTNMNWKNILLIIVVFIIFGLIAYFFYKQYSHSTTAYSANRENKSKNENEKKQCELMLFSVDWCPHCKTAKPEWDNLKSEYEGKTINGYTIIFTEHNCTNENAETEALMNKFKIEGYPTIKLIKDNQVIEYDAKPTKDTMSQFLNTVL